MRKYTVIIGDSRNMKEVKDRCVHLVVTSPPYFNLVDFSGEGEDKNELSSLKTKEEFFTEITNVWKEVERILLPGCYFFINFMDYAVAERLYGYTREVSLVGDMVRTIESTGLYLISRWVWRKYDQVMSMHKALTATYESVQRGSDVRAVANYEYCLVFKKRNPLVTGRRDYKLDFSKDEWYRWCDGVWNVGVATEAGENKRIAGGAVFPMEIPRRAIKLYTQVGETVLDPFLGTGTTMKAAFETGRSCIGYEVLPKMLPIIKSKVGWGQQNLEEEIEWSVIER